MSFSSTLLDVSERLLTTYGRSATFTRVTEGSYNTATSAVAAGSSSTYSSYIHPYPFSADEIDDTNVLRGDVAVIAYSATTPEVGDTVVIDTKTYRVVQAQKISAQGTNIYYRLQVRA